MSRWSPRQLGRHGRVMPQDFLPPARRPVFLATVAEFLLYPWRAVARDARSAAAPHPAADGRSLAKQMEDEVRRHVSDTAGPQVCSAPSLPQLPHVRSRMRGHARATPSPRLRRHIGGQH